MPTYAAMIAKKSNKSAPSRGERPCGVVRWRRFSVVAVLGHLALGKKMTALFVENGLMRAGEAKQVREMSKAWASRCRFGCAAEVPRRPERQDGPGN
jgi:hypothetical protein